ncbi:MAG: site-specific DNA-methyltransferase [Bacteroidota bacterium]
MDKLKLHSPNLSQDNIAKIRDLFPGCVTEASDKDGKVQMAVDFDQLRQELSDHIVEGPQERYRLDWPGKREALVTANAPITKTLRPSREDSPNFDETRNLFIEGDNLDAIKLLQESYLGQVDVIYIDPPYNTGSDLIYNDQFAVSSEDFFLISSQIDCNGSALVSNKETNGRFHSDWLKMIYPRLKLARNFLSDRGAIFISIGENEVENLKKIAGEIFGYENFVSQVTRVAKRTSDKGTHFRPTKDYILVYAKNIIELPEFGIPKDRDENDYKFTDEDGRKYKQSGASLYQPSLSSRSNQRYYIKAPDGSLIIPPGNVFPVIKEDAEKIKPKSDADKVWRWSVDSYLKQKHLLMFTEGSSKNPLLDQFGNQSKWNIYPKVFFDKDIKSTLHPEDIIYPFPNSQGTKELKLLSIPFSFAKPVNLIKFLIKLSNEKNILVMDFFAGSATTAHAVMQLNADDGGNRNFIMIQWPEPCEKNSEARQAGYETIADLSQERIRRAGRKILEGDCHPNWNKDVGFRVLKIDSSNMQDVYYRPDEVKQTDLITTVDNVKPDRTEEDLLFQVLVDWGVDLTLTIHRKIVQGKTIFFVDNNTLVACFDTGITEELVKELAKHKPAKVVFRDSSFVSDAVKINVEQIFRQLSPATEIKSI